MHIQIKSLIEHAFIVVKISLECQNIPELWTQGCLWVKTQAKSLQIFMTIEKQ